MSEQEVIDKIRRITYISQSDSQCKVLISLLMQTKDIEGDIVEVGVYRGGSALLLAEYKYNKALYLFDTFEGMPEPEEVDRKGRPSTSGKGYLYYPDALEYITNLFVDKHSNVHIYKGIFPESSEPIKNKKFSFVHLDIDFYKGTLESLKFFYPRMSIGGVILVHDYGWCNTAGIKIAVEEFIKDKIEVPIIIGYQWYIIKK